MLLPDENSARVAGLTHCSQFSLITLTVSSSIKYNVAAGNTDTGKVPLSVDTFSVFIRTDGGVLTLVNVPALPNRSQLKASMASASMASWQVEAGAIATEARTSVAFVNVYALISCWGKSETFLANTSEASCNI